MSAVFRRNRKGSDYDIVRLNGVGLSLGAIARRFGCHTSSVTLRLKTLNVTPADTRRTFMEDVFADLPENAIDEVADLLMANDNDQPKSIKSYVRSLIDADIRARRAASTSSDPEQASPTPTP